MKLSSVLKDWPEKKTVCISKWHTEPYSDSEGYINSRRCPECKDITSGFTEKEKMTFNAALTSCDREIDREALAKVMYEVSVNYDGFKPVLFVLEDLVPWEEQLTSIKESYLLKADLTISTMPTWLKRSEDK